MLSLMAVMSALDLCSFLSLLGHCWERFCSMGLLIEAGMQGSATNQIPKM